MRRVSQLGKKNVESSETTEKREVKKKEQKTPSRFWSRLAVAVIVAILAVGIWIGIENRKEVQANAAKRRANERIAFLTRCAEENIFAEGCPAIVRKELHVIPAGKMLRQPIPNGYRIAWRGNAEKLVVTCKWRGEIMEQRFQAAEGVDTVHVHTHLFKPRNPYDGSPSACS